MITINPNEINKIVNIIDAGNVVGLPTDTVYGLVCKFDYEKAIERIYEIKKRSLKKPLQILVSSWQEAKQYGIFDDHLVKYLEDKFSKGTVTVVVRKQNTLNKINYWNQWDSVAIRVANSPFIKQIINSVGPLAASSCNISGSSTINDSSKINLESLKYVVEGVVVDAKASTVYDSINDIIIRF